MRRFGHKRRPLLSLVLRGMCLLSLLLAPLAGARPALGQSPSTNTDDLTQQVQQLTAAMAREQTQIEQSQRELNEMRAQLAALQARMAAGVASAGTNAAAVGTAPAVANSTTPAAASVKTQESPADDTQDVRERQAMQQSQIATLDQAKVESASKYPVRISGLILFNGFANTSAVDIASTPTIAVGGAGSTGASVRQTMLGIEATGPHLFGARSYADLEVDFEGNTQGSSSTGAYTGYYSGSDALLRLRTAHAGLEWQHTDAYFSLDRPIISPDSPSSLVATATPALAWSGNLWTWNPQLGITHDVSLGSAQSLRVQGALIDAGDAPVTPLALPVSNPGVVLPTPAEQSRWPGLEARIAWLGSTDQEKATHFGIGGYFAPHIVPVVNRRFDAWAVTADARLHLPGRLYFTSSAYRGLGLGGLGGGAFKDFMTRPNASMTSYYTRPLEDVGGWAELKERVSTRLELNAAFGMDNAFAKDVRPYAAYTAGSYFNLARNRTYTGNVIYSPSSYLLFSLEYRYLDSSTVTGPSTRANVIGVAAGYKF